jgi:Domain of unknown function DUF29
MNNLYEQDFNLWTEQMAIAIRERNVIDMDWDNLSEEIDDMSKSEKRSLESYLERLIEHILKLQYWESEYQRNYRHWRAEVTNFRNRIKRIVYRSPSLNNYMSEVYSGIFQDAVDAKSNEFEIPDDCFIPLEKMLEKDYFG